MKTLLLSVIIVRRRKQRTALETGRWQRTVEKDFRLFLKEENGVRAASRRMLGPERSPVSEGIRKEVLSRITPK